MWWGSHDTLAGWYSATCSAASCERDDGCIAEDNDNLLYQILGVNSQHDFAFPVFYALK